MYPREAPEKPLLINAGARNKVVFGAMAGFTVLGAALVYIFDMVSLSTKITLKLGLKIEPSMEISITFIHLHRDL